MWVEMKIQIGGTRNGFPWPAKGEFIELPDAEAQDLAAAGYARLVEEHEFLDPDDEEDDEGDNDGSSQEADGGSTPATGGEGDTSADNAGGGAGGAAGDGSGSDSGSDGGSATGAGPTSAAERVTSARKRAQSKSR